MDETCYFQKKDMECGNQKVFWGGLNALRFCAHQSHLWMIFANEKVYPAKKNPGNGRQRLEEGCFWVPGWSTSCVEPAQNLRRTCVEPA
jgi:hypothetical protein